MAPMKRPASHHDSIYGDTLSLAVAARRLHLSRKNLRHLLGTGRVNFVQVRGQFRVPEKEIDELKHATAASAE